MSGNLIFMLTVFLQYYTVGSVFGVLAGGIVATMATLTLQGKNRSILLGHYSFPSTGVINVAIK